MWKKEHKSWNAASPGVSKKRLVRWRRRRRSNQGFGGVRFSASLERGTGERNSFLFLSPSREICACERVYSSLLVDERWCSARAWRERRQCTFPAESFRRESSAHHAREWVRSFPSVECCSTGSISATIPEAPRLLLLNGYSCFWKDPLPYENERCNKWWIKTRHLLSFYFGFLENVWHFEIRRLWNWIRTIFIAMRCYIFVSYHKLKYGYFLKIKNYLARKIMHL